MPSANKRQIEIDGQAAEEANWRRRLEDKRLDKERRDNEQREKFGTVTYTRKPDNSPEVTAKPVEIEVPWGLDQLVKFEILSELGYSYREWIQECYLHRMKEILTNPTVFEGVVLEPVKRGHCLDDEDLEGDC